MKYSMLAVVVLGAALFAPMQSEAGGTVAVQVVSAKVQVSARSVNFSTSSPSVTWQMQTAGFKLTAQSVDFGSAAGQFSCSAAGDGLSVTCTINSKTTTSGNYTVSAQASSGPTPAGSDPKVWTVSD